VAALDVGNEEDHPLLALRMEVLHGLVVLEQAEGEGISAPVVERLGLVRLHR
jgi:hypothetical protein